MSAKKNTLSLLVASLVVVVDIDFDHNEDNELGFLVFFRLYWLFVLWCVENDTVEVGEDNSWNSIMSNMNSIIPISVL